MLRSARLVFACCAAALLLGRAAMGCGSPSPGDASSSGTDSSSSSGGPCEHCNTIEMAKGQTTVPCPASKATYDAVEACKCGPMCMGDCMAACGGAALDTPCITCLDAMCHNQLAACIADQ